jgi:hypothetical protein
VWLRDEDGAVPLSEIDDDDVGARREPVTRELFVCARLEYDILAHLPCPDCGHRADAHTAELSCDVCAVIRAVG